MDNGKLAEIKLSIATRLCGYYKARGMSMAEADNLSYIKVRRANIDTLREIYNKFEQWSENSPDLFKDF